MKKSNEQIKYVVTEGGEQLGVTQRSPKIGERYVEANGKIETAVRNFRNTACLVLTELDTPPVVGREVVESLFAAAKSVANGWAASSFGASRVAVSRLKINNLSQALAATEEALNPKPKERYYTQETAVWDRERGELGEFVCGCDTAEAASTIARALNAQVGEK